ncbi:hypothetical protein N665_0084s0015 [Sinapis alba]|nr:hypothetical protein N665_0084s0015 [Sinapis alba]
MGRHKATRTRRARVAILRPTHAEHGLSYGDLHTQVAITMLFVSSQSELSLELYEVEPTTPAPPKEPIHARDYIPKIYGDSDVMMVSKECNAVLQNKAIKKLGDPGKFVLSVQIGRIVFACSLFNLGSSVNLMPYSLVKRLGFTAFKSTRKSLVFADRSVKMPLGVLKDLQVQIGKLWSQLIFLVLDLDEEPKHPLILGWPFLCTAGAIIDFRHGKIDLHLGDIVMKFEMDKLLKKPLLD